MADLSIDEIARVLDERHPQWFISRTYDRRWLVQIRFGEMTKNIDHECLESAMKAAHEHRFLELVPREPYVRVRSRFSIQKNGKSWVLTSDGGGQCGFKTRKAAEQAIERWVENDEMLRRAWEDEFGWSRACAEGVDFHWATVPYSLGMKRQAS